MAGKNFQIYSVQITGKWICKTFTPLPFIDLIISPRVKHPSVNFLKKLCSPMQRFVKKKVPPILWRWREGRHYVLSS